GTKSEFCSNKDIAVIRLTKMPGRATPLRFGDSSKVRTGERIYIIGNSLGEGTCITSGIISDNDRNGQFMYDSATNGGNSGGPVFDEDGHVIATHVRGKLDGRGIKVQGMNGGIPCDPTNPVSNNRVGDDVLDVPSEMCKMSGR
ncbi:MAG: trypsin-like peptidase domain-containing protein, partial [Clostridia bacterium]|nr:trypsin-like peptidase domain-containing protein [Clostridia bacterium]